MVASRDTILSIYTILSVHLTQKQMEDILGDLIEVPGNKSFRDTVEQLMLLHRRRQVGEKRENYRYR